MERECKNINTILVRDEEKNPWNAINVPVCFSSTYEFNSIKDAEMTFNGSLDNFCYSRLGNPTVKAFESKINEIESGYETFAFSTGMAAITSVLLALCVPGDFISCIDEVYGGTHELLKTLVKNLGIRVFTFSSDFSGLRTTETALKKTKLIFIESPTNPSLHEVDLRRAVTEAHFFEEAYVCVDNTFATPYFQQPIYQYGVDLVVHSATKYIGGHGDLLGGTVTVSERCQHLAEKIKAIRTSTGAMMDPMTAYLCLRGLKTLGVRMQRHTVNALTLSSLFDEYNIKHTYPNMSGMLSVEFDSRETAQDFIQNLKGVKLAVSLGETQTLVNVPSLMTHATYSDSELLSLGLNPGVVRISVGLEDTIELREDFERALKAL